MNWLALSFIAIFLWGIGSFSGKFAEYFGATGRQIYLFEIIGTITVACVYLFFFERKTIEYTIDNFSWNITLASLGMGIAWGIATITFILALTKGPATIIVPLTASYPIVTVLLVLLFKKYFHESIDFIKLFGILMTMGGIILLSISKK